MYAAGTGIKPWRATRAGGPRRLRRVAAGLGVFLIFGLGLAVAARGASGPGMTTIVVQPGDTLWSIAADHYPSDDVRQRVQEIEDSNGLRGPQIEVGQTLKLPR